MIEQQKGIEIVERRRRDTPPKLHARAFDNGLRFDDLFDSSWSPLHSPSSNLHARYCWRLSSLVSRLLEPTVSRDDQSIAEFSPFVPRQRCPWQSRDLWAARDFRRR